MIKNNKILAKLAGNKTIEPKQINKESNVPAKNKDTNLAGVYREIKGMQSNFIR